MLPSPGSRACVINPSVRAVTVRVALYSFIPSAYIFCVSSDGLDLSHTLGVLHVAAPIPLYYHCTATYGAVIHSITVTIWWWLWRGLLLVDCLGCWLNLSWHLLIASRFSFRSLTRSSASKRWEVTGGFHQQRSWFQSSSFHVRSFCKHSLGFDRVLQHVGDFLVAFQRRRPIADKRSPCVAAFPIGSTPRTRYCKCKWW